MSGAGCLPRPPCPPFRRGRRGGRHALGQHRRLSSVRCLGWGVACREPGVLANFQKARRAVDAFLDGEDARPGLLPRLPTLTIHLCDSELDHKGMSGQVGRLSSLKSAMRCFLSSSSRLCSLMAGLRCSESTKVVVVSSFMYGATIGGSVSSAMVVPVALVNPPLLDILAWICVCVLPSLCRRRASLCPSRLARQIVWPPEVAISTGVSVRCSSICKLKRVGAFGLQVWALDWGRALYLQG